MGVVVPVFLFRPLERVASFWRVKMLTRMNYEDQLLKEIKGLPTKDVAKIVKVVHLIKEDILEKKVKGLRKNILQYAGMLKELTVEESKVFDEAVARKSLFGGRKIKV